MKVFVAGATGETGRRVVKELVKQNISVRAMVRNLETGREILPPEAEFVVGDVLNRDSLVSAMADCTHLICATGATPSFDITGFYKVDYQGTKNLVNVAKSKNIQQFVLVSSLCVSKFFHPLNLFGLVLYWKQQAENYIQQSGLPYTIVRPGGLLNEDNSDSIIMASADTLFEGRIPRTKVAETCVATLFQPEAKNKIVEIVAAPDAPAKDWPQLFASVT